MISKEQRYHEYIWNDPQIRGLESKRFEIYSLAIPQFILKKNGEVETIWLDETNHPLLSKINKLIDSRKQELKQLAGL